MTGLVHPRLSVDALIEAAEVEAEYERTWLPREPWWDAILASKREYCAALHRKLARGVTWPRSAIVDARKPSHAVRPIALMGPDVRIVYRAMAAGLVPAEARSDRSAEAYAEFALNPIRHAFDPTPGLKQVGLASYTHVLTTDLAAFYQFIDHGILREELDLAGADIELVDALIEFLGEIEGRSFGIPQRSEPSDWISESYAARIERAVIRDGFDIWRYTDDFRVGCRSYAEALEAIEALARAARDVGLVLNEQKTAAPTFATYLWHTASIEVHDAAAEIDPTDVEAAVSADYVPEDEEQDVAEAQRTIADLLERDQVSWGDEPIVDLKALDADEHRALRRALSTVTRAGDSSALPLLLPILAYQPAITHKVIRYAEAVAEDAGAGVEEFFDQAIRHVSMNAWQRAWVAHGLRVCRIPLPPQSERVRWLHEAFDRTDSAATIEAAVTLANVNQISFSSLETRLAFAHSDFGPWYLHAIALLRASGAAPERQIAALKSMSPAAAAILS